MEKRTMKLTAANIRYLLAIGEQENMENGVRCISVAQTLGVSKPSVHTMIESMQQMGLLEKCRYGVIHMTPEGLQLIQQYLHFYKTICAHFAPLFSHPEDVSSAALALLTTLPPEGIEDFCSRLAEEEVAVAVGA